MLVTSGRRWRKRYSSCCSFLASGSLPAPSHTHLVLLLEVGVGDPNLRLERLVLSAENVDPLLQGLLELLEALGVRSVVPLVLCVEPPACTFQVLEAVSEL